MRSIVDMDTVQIEVTNFCRNSCSNCTRFCGHREPFFMSLDQYKQAVDSMAEYPKMTGMQGGEPLLHPGFEEMCAYLRSKIPKEKCGLWTTLPEGYERYREILCATFEHIFVNDHTRDDINHHPPLVAIEEAVPDKNHMWYAIDHCWAQMSWSASIYPNGAWFCEIAGSMSMLFKEEGKQGWPIEPGWWWRIPADFREQMDMFCSRCGFPIKIRRRSSLDMIDDVSKGNLERLQAISSKVRRGLYLVYDFEDGSEDARKELKLANYKDTDWRNVVMSRYGMTSYVNRWGFWTPILIDGWSPENPVKAGCQDPRLMGDIIKEHHGQ